MVPQCSFDVHFSLIITDLENKFVVAKGEGGGSGMDGEFGVHGCKLFHLEWKSSEVLLWLIGLRT